MSVPQQTLEQIKTRVDIVDVVGQRVELRRAGKEYKGLCPFHDDNNPSLAVVPGKQLYICNACGASGDVIKFLMEHDGISFPESVRALAESAGVAFEQDVSSRPNHSEELALMQEVAEFYQTVLSKNGRAAAYLKHRGIKKRTIQRYGLGYAPPSGDHLEQVFGRSSKRRQMMIELGVLHQGNGRGPYAALRDRIVFPIRNHQGHVVAFGGRLLEDNNSAPKYLNTKESALFRKKDTLYGWGEAVEDQRWRRCLGVVEGYMDAIALTQEGFPAVAAMGVALSEPQARRLLTPGTPLAFAFDGDEAGQRAAFKACLSLLTAFRRPTTVRLVQMPEGADPDSLLRKGRDAWRSVLKDSLPLSRFLTEVAPARVAGRIEPLTVEDWAIYLEELLPHLAKMPNATLKYLLLDAIGNQAGVNEITLKRLLAATERAAR